MSVGALDPLIHDPERLRVIATLATLPDGDALSVTRLQDMIRLAPGSLITCLRELCPAALEPLPPPEDLEVHASNPEEACLAALDAGLVLRSAHPLNGETPLSALDGPAVVPNARFYVRNHFAIPHLDARSVASAVGGWCCSRYREGPAIVGDPW